MWNFFEEDSLNRYTNGKRAQPPSVDRIASDQSH